MCEDSKKKPAQADDGAESPESQGGQGGQAPPTNRAIATYESVSAHLLRHGVNTAILSFSGSLFPEVETLLEEFKNLAQSPKEEDQLQAVIQVEDHTFEVQDKGSGRFAYVLVNNWFRIQISKSTAKNFPMLYVQVSSDFLAAFSLEKAEEILSILAPNFGEIQEKAKVSRIDLFVDFTSPYQMDSWQPIAWVTKAKKKTRHDFGNHFTGWSIGSGGNINAREYDKSFEIDQKNHKQYLPSLWSEAGRQSDQPVWRLEFEIKREIFKQLNINHVFQLIKIQGLLWHYLTTEWLRLTIPNPLDPNQSRWPIHPLWQVLSSLDWEQPPGPKLKRVRKDRPPLDETLFLNGLGGITSLMALTGIQDLNEGLEMFQARATEFHRNYGSDSRNINDYVAHVDTGLKM
jgi:hypothetical protein